MCQHLRLMDWCIKHLEIIRTDLQPLFVPSIGCNHIALVMRVMPHTPGTPATNTPAGSTFGQVNPCKSLVCLPKRCKRTISCFSTLVLRRPVSAGGKHRKPQIRFRTQRNEGNRYSRYDVSSILYPIPRAINIPKKTIPTQIFHELTV